MGRKKKENIAGELTAELQAHLAAWIKKTPAERGSSIGFFSESAAVPDIPCWIPTGVPALDYAIGYPHGLGIPCGRLTEIFGDPSSGKSTLALSIIAEAQKMGAITVLIEPEHVMDRTFIARAGVQEDTVLYSDVKLIESVFETIEAAVMAVRRRDPDQLMLVVLDSVAATTCNAEVDQEYTDTDYPRHAKVISTSMRRFYPVMTKMNVALVFLNQQKEKIGVMFGDKYTTFGGRAIRFYASVRISIKKTGTIKVRDVPVGIRVKTTVEKSKVAAPFRYADFNIMFADGVDKEKALVDFGVQAGVVRLVKSKGGNRYALPEGEYRERDVRKMLEEVFDLPDRIYGAVGYQLPDVEDDSPIETDDEEE